MCVDALLWETSHMPSQSNDEMSPLQRAVANALARAPQKRDYYDRQLQGLLKTTGKPLYDIQRGKSKNPAAKTLRAMAEVFDLPADAFAKVLAGGLDHFDPDLPPIRSADGGEAVEITSLDLSLAMGPGTIIDDFVESEPVIFDAAQLRRITRSPFTRLRAVTGIGTSHEPKFHASDQFLIDINERQLSKLDGYYWITFEGAHALKRLRPMGGGKIQIISENPDFEPIIADAEDVRIEGRAVWVARGL